MLSNIAMVPARMGSQRLKHKNLRKLAGIPLITRNVRKCKEAGVFDEIWVNSENSIFGEIASIEGVKFHQRPQIFANNKATSEQYITEFLRNHNCRFVVQVHSIAPLLTIKDIRDFVAVVSENQYDCLLSVDLVQIECAFHDQPVNFSFLEKTNSQELKPIQRVNWSITAWRRETYLDAVASGKCATYAGRVGFFSISPLAGHIIKTERDLQVAEALLPLVEGG